MIDLKKTQEEVINNKKRHGFDTSNIYREFCLLYGEVGEAFDAYRKKKNDLHFCRVSKHSVILIFNVRKIMH